MPKIPHPTVKEVCALIDGLNEATVQQRISPGTGGSTRVKWLSELVDGIRRIYYKKIPAKCRAKYNMPSPEIFDEMLAKYREAAAAAEQERQAKPTREIEALYLTLKDEMRSRYHGCYNLVNEQYNLPADKVRLAAERWSAMQYLSESYSGQLLRTTSALQMLFPGWLSDKFSTANFLKKYTASGLDACIDSRWITKAQKHTSSFIEAFLKAQYVLPQKVLAPAAHAALIAACAEQGEKPCSLSTVKNRFADYKNNIELYRLRYGQAAAQKRLPFNTLLPAEHKNSQWQCDGWTLPFWGYKFQRYVIYCVWDNHSRRIVGFSIGQSENTTLIMEALEDAIRETGFVPAEIVSDKHSFHKTEVATNLKAKLAAMGVTFTVTMNAQRNQLAERGNQYLHSHCEKFEGCLGKNVTAKSDDARPAPEVLAELAKSKNWKTEEEIKAIGVYAATEHNRSALQPLGGLSPNEKYAQSESLKAFAMSEEERVKLIRPVKYYTVKRGQITIKLGMAKHEFQLNADLIDRYENKVLEVVYEDLAQGIYILDGLTGESLGAVSPKVKIHGALADQTEEDKRRFNQATGRTNGTISKSRKKVAATIEEALKERPEAIEIIDSYGLSKDIRQIARQDAEVKARLRDMEVSEQLLPIRTQTPVALQTITASAAAKSKESPFTDTKHVMRKLTMEELYPKAQQSQQ